MSRMNTVSFGIRYVSCHEVFRALLNMHFFIYTTIPRTVCNVLYAAHVSSRSLDTDTALHYASSYMNILVSSHKCSFFALCILLTDKPHIKICLACVNFWQSCVPTTFLHALHKFYQMSPIIFFKQALVQP